MRAAPAKHEMIGREHVVLLSACLVLRVLAFGVPYVPVRVRAAEAQDVSCGRSKRYG